MTVRHHSRETEIQPFESQPIPPEAKNLSPTKGLRRRGDSAQPTSFGCPTNETGSISAHGGIGRSLALPRSVFWVPGRTHRSVGGITVDPEPGVGGGSRGVFAGEYRQLAIDFPPKPVTLGDSRFPGVEDAGMVVCSPFAVLCLSESGASWARITPATRCGKRPGLPRRLPRSSKPRPRSGRRLKRPRSNPGYCTPAAACRLGLSSSGV